MTQYETLDNRTYRVVDGERQLLANFIARIIEETRFVDGANTETYLTLEGVGPGDSEDPNEEPEPTIHPAVTMPASSFAGMGWALSSWGARAVISPGSSVKEDLRTSIQLASRPKITTVYRHLGWDKAGNRYMHAGGAISKDGNDNKVRVELPQELQHYKLELGDKKTTRRAVECTLAVLSVAPGSITWPLLAATVAPILGACDYGMHLTGRTGTYKSELTSLFQSHYGSEMDARHLPGSWSSTGNALEAQAYYAKNALFTIDDFVPTGTTWQQRAYQTTADKLFRAQGNQAGRARLTDTSNLQTAMYPRGLILSTGEDTPDGHSVRARMMILELAPGDVNLKKLTVSQQNRLLLKYTLGGFVQWVAATKPDIKPYAQKVRDANLGVGHARTPAMLGNLVASIAQFLAWCHQSGAVSKAEAEALLGTATKEIIDAGKRQITYLETIDPVEIFAAAMRDVFGRRLGHIRTQSGGIPRKAELLGWIRQEDSQSDVPTFTSHGPCIGWINWDAGELYLNAELGYNVVKKAAGAEITLSKQTLMKRLKEAGTLTRTDDARQRNTVRITAERHPHQVLSLSIPLVLDTSEKPNGTQEEDAGSGTDF